MTAKRIGFALLLATVAGSAASAQTPLFRSKPLPPPPGDARQVIKPVNATDVLSGSQTAQPPAAGQPLPPGTVESPWSGGSPAGGYDGPVGANGPITYEVSSYTGPSLPIWGGHLASRLSTGWTVGTMTRSLFYNTESDAAWVLYAGLSYTYNRGFRDSANMITEVATPRQRQAVDPVTGALRFDSSGNVILERNPVDGLAAYYIRGFHRTSFNFGVGRDWWLNGPGLPGAESSSNWRYGVDAGGKWGTAHVDLEHVSSDQIYLRRAGVYQAISLGQTLNWDRPFGGVIFYAGIRTEWVYNFMNIIPPQAGDLRDFSILMYGGIRF